MSEPQPSSELVQVLVENRRELLGYVERRVGSRALAEDILQDTFARSLDKVESLRREESVLAWFRRALHNAVIDHYRRNEVSRRALSALAGELETPETPAEMSATVCKCVSRLATTLKPEYADALQQIELDGVSVKDFAEARGLSSNNAGVRVFRAREALRKQLVVSCGTCAEHGCRDCTCSHP